MIKNFKYSTTIKHTLVAGIFSIVSLVFMILALLDIYQGNEADLKTEWIVVTRGIIINIVFALLAVFTTASLLTTKV
jgi:hypothetical protein